MAKVAKKRVVRRVKAAKGARSAGGAARAKGDKVFCPCCPTWEIKFPERCSNTLERAGRTLFFCTRRCKDKFARSPEKYATRA